MEWQDDEFETFLLQFQPRRPKALPNHRRTWIALGIAAGVGVAVVMPLRLVPRNSTRPPSPTSSTITNSTERSTGDTKSQSKTFDAATSSPVGGAGQANVPLLKAPVPVMRGGVSQRVRAGETVRPPTKVFDVKPEYPEEARAAGIEGAVILQIVIGRDGSVIDAQVARSIPELDDAAIEAVTQWRFESTLLNGEAVEVEVNVVINFSLDSRQ